MIHMNFLANLVIYNYKYFFHYYDKVELMN